MKEGKYINTQRLKRLLVGWKTLSTSFKKREDHTSAGVVDYCIIDLEGVLSESDIAQKNIQEVHNGVSFK